MTLAQWILAYFLVSSVLCSGIRAGAWRDWSHNMAVNIISIIVSLAWIAILAWAMFDVGAFRSLTP